MYAESDGDIYRARIFHQPYPLRKATLKNLETNLFEINRLPVSDLEKFQRVAVPIWFKWANKDKDAARLFRLQLEVMESPTFGYVTPDMYKGQKLEI